MSVIVKIAAALLIAGGIWIWLSGNSVTAKKQEVRVPTAKLAAGAGITVEAAQGRFEEEGTIILDMSEGSSSRPFLLYTSYDAQGRPSVMTKRLIFPNQAECGKLGLPCASQQPDAPVQADERVRILGQVRDDAVTVETVTHLPG
jgi:hypothetical protein